jgi:hypothetical protein
MLRFEWNQYAFIYVNDAFNKCYYMSQDVEVRLSRNRVSGDIFVN